jgi:putative spermidine/putrescine transport system permease protein
MSQAQLSNNMANIGDAPSARPQTRKRNLDWVGLVPFFLFVTLFLILPSLNIFIRSFQQVGTGDFTFENIIAIFSRADLRNAYKASLTISLITAIGGSIFGFLLAYAVCLSGMPVGFRTFLLTFSGVASNFAGVPLAFAFIATIGITGLVTRWIQGITGVDLREAGFSIYNIWGLSIVYMYFQFPLMVLIMAPALDGLRREWREACENLGGTGGQYWRYIAFPILLPTLLGTTILLFGNAFGAYATAYAFSGSFINLVTILIGAQMQGDVLTNPNLGYALALGMVIIMALCMVGYAYLQRRAARWSR